MKGGDFMTIKTLTALRIVLTIVGVALAGVGSILDIKSKNLIIEKTVAKIVEKKIGG